MGGGMGRGKHKGKPTGKRSFSTPEEIKAGTSSEPKWKARRDRGEEKDGDESSGEEEEDDEAVEGEDEKSKGVAGLIQVENPNAPKKAAVKASQANVNAATELSRREREELAKQQAKERYMKLQEQGKTEQAQKDLERLKEIRQQREEAAKRREERVAKEAKKLEARK
eukprot:TRINITY_DN1359_c0_g1_i1.p1 TRINITY_DN1359_c0_g1~~TRINITY_DN1359_c0_g1_i1.p1  ORF type:complete len:168 (+),score=66.61 TRINITY_DN1359_c0_g1_i1:143-646(+)